MNRILEEALPPAGGLSRLQRRLRGRRVRNRAMLAALATVGLVIGLQHGASEAPRGLADSTLGRLLAGSGPGLRTGQGGVLQDPVSDEQISIYWVVPTPADAES